MAFSQRILFWDLDGTLTDPADGIVHSVQYALRHFGLEAPREQLLSFIGPPLTDSFAETFGFSDENCKKAVVIYRGYFKKKGIFENEPYPGIAELLEKLSALGFRHYLASSKPEPLCVRILEHFGLARCFTAVAGSDFAGTRARKEQVLAYLMERDGISASSALMIGDRRFDAEGAAEFGIPCIGVLWGYGSREELETAGCAALASDLEELYSLLTV